jgi:lactoylglutathione lyase
MDLHENNQAPLYPIDGLITFLYYKDLDKVAKFYEEVIGLKMVLDQGIARIFQVVEHAYIGVVDETRGYHHANAIKPVEITILVPDVDAWYRRIRALGVETIDEPHDIPGVNVRAFLLQDPEGYVIEIQKFL